MTACEPATSRLVPNPFAANRNATIARRFPRNTPFRFSTCRRRAFRRAREHQFDEIAHAADRHAERQRLASTEEQAIAEIAA
jgi:hypothetical protein